MAKVVRWDPFNEMMTLRGAFSGMFDESTLGRAATTTMPLNVAETKEAFLIEAVVPGIKEEDLDITLENNTLRITGETRQEQHEGEKPHYHRVERRYGRLSRTIGFPVAVQSDAVKATLENGVLRLEVPKSEALKPRKISLTTTTIPQELDVEAAPEEIAAN